MAYNRPKIKYLNLPANYAPHHRPVRLLRRIYDFCYRKTHWHLSSITSKVYVFRNDPFIKHEGIACTIQGT